MPQRWTSLGCVHCAEGEPLNSELADSLKAANDMYLRLNSYGVRAMAMVSRLAAEGEDKAIKNPGQKAWKRVAATVTKAEKGGVTEEQRQEVEEDEELVRLVASVKEAVEACTSKRDELEFGPMAVTTVLASTDVPTALWTLPRLVNDRRPLRRNYEPPSSLASRAEAEKSAGGKQGTACKARYHGDRTERSGSVGDADGEEDGGAHC
ncbi:hypothetical protein CF327_g6974 [Tilletia walkeri]|nr:hypothetical protein CF327_g6974 [Tilletia walkeri]